MVAVAQLVRAPVCGTGGCGFNSRQPPLLDSQRKMCCPQFQDVLSAVRSVGPQSAVWEEAENRRHVQKALLSFLDAQAEVA